MRGKKNFLPLLLLLAGSVAQAQQIPPLWRPSGSADIQTVIDRAVAIGKSSATQTIKFYEDPANGTDTVQLKAPASVTTGYTLQLPAAPPAANDYVLTVDMDGTSTYEAGVGAAGSDTEIQFNSSGSFGASSELTWDDTNKRLTSAGTALPGYIVQNTTPADADDEKWLMWVSTVGNLFFSAVTAAEGLSVTPVAIGRNGNVQFGGQITLGVSPTDPPIQGNASSAEPSGPTADSIYLDDGTNTATGGASWRMYDGASWVDLGGAGNVVKVGTPVDNQVGVWTGDGTIEGDAALTYDGTTLSLVGTPTIGITTGTFNSKDSLVLDGGIVFNTTPSTGLQAQDTAGTVRTMFTTETFSTTKDRLKFGGGAWEEIKYDVNASDGRMSFTWSDVEKINFDTTFGLNVLDGSVTITETDTGAIPLTVTSAAGPAANIVVFNDGGTDRFILDQNGDVTVAGDIWVNNVGVDRFMGGTESTQQGMKLQADGGVTFRVNAPSSLYTINVAGNTRVLFSDDTLRASGSNQYNLGTASQKWKSFHTHAANVYNTMGNTPDDAKGLSIQNEAAAVANVVGDDGQQYSPAIRWEGQGWETTGGSSDSAEFRAYVVPVQGAAVSGIWYLESSMNAGAYTARLFANSNGTVTVGPDNRTNATSSNNKLNVHDGFIELSSSAGTAGKINFRRFATSNADAQAANIEASEGMTLTTSGNGDLTFTTGGTGDIVFDSSGSMLFTGVDWIWNSNSNATSTFQIKANKTVIIDATGSGGATAEKISFRNNSNEYGSLDENGTWAFGPGAAIGSDTMTITSIANPSATVLTVNGAGTPTGNLQEWQVGGTEAAAFVSGQNSTNCQLTFGNPSGGEVATTDSDIWIKRSVNSRVGLEFQNTGTGTSAGARFTIVASDSSYGMMALGCIGNTGPNVFGEARTDIVFIQTVANGGTARHLVLGTNDAADVVLGTDNTERVRVENTTGDVSVATGHLERSTTASITASVTQTQGQQALTTDINEISVCANVNDVVTLPAAVAGRTITVINNGAQTLQVFPASGDNLGAGVDTSTTITAGNHKRFQAYDGTNWVDIT